MYSINTEATPSTRAWDNGKLLAETTLKTYFKKHEDWPRKVSYTFWAGEFIETEGATFAQALYMLGVEPIRDGMGRVTDIRLIPSEELKRPRIDIVVQTSGQLRDLPPGHVEQSGWYGRRIGRRLIRKLCGGRCRRIGKTAGRKRNIT